MASECCTTPECAIYVSGERGDKYYGSASSLMNAKAICEALARYFAAAENIEVQKVYATDVHTKVVCEYATASYKPSGAAPLAKAPLDHVWLVAELPTKGIQTDCVYMELNAEARVYDKYKYTADGWQKLGSEPCENVIASLMEA